MEAYEWSFRKRWRNFKWKVKFAASQYRRLSVICAVVLSAVFLLSCFLWQRKGPLSPVCKFLSSFKYPSSNSICNKKKNR